jgi:hypothetical protein
LPFLGTPISRLAFVAVAVAVEFVFEFLAAAFRRAPSTSPLNLPRPAQSPTTRVRASSLLFPEMGTPARS